MTGELLTGLLASSSGLQCQLVAQRTNRIWRGDFLVARTFIIYSVVFMARTEAAVDEWTADKAVATGTRPHN